MKSMLNNDEVLNDLLGYDGLKIIQRPDMFSFSLDSTLLADFVKINNKVKTILDFGTGFAPIPLFLSLKTKAKITAIEIQEEVADIAKRNVAINHLENQIDVKIMDIKESTKHFDPTSFDMITCNPPFFKYKETSNVNQSLYKTIARHEVKIDLDSIIRTAKILLKSRGHLVMVHRSERLSEIITRLESHKFAIKRLRFVYPKEGQEAFMVLIDATNNGQSGVKIEPPLIVHNDSGYTDEIKRIFNYGKE